ncbi:MAG: type II toxin-antitoxin system VapC family toxin [Gammaproteobacteria bacterium]
MIRYVLDASALLAFLWREPGCERVESVLALESVAISAVNVAEVLTKAIDLGLPDEAVGELQASFDFEQVPFDHAAAAHAAAMRRATRHLGLSLGDRACLALASGRGAVALTADRAWIGLDLGVQVECVR